jgi:hypothetical protein
MSILLIHYFVAVVQPKREKQGVKSMYSIEYSPQYAGDSRLVQYVIVKSTYSFEYYEPQYACDSRLVQYLSKGSSPCTP